MIRISKIVAFVVQYYFKKTFAYLRKRAPHLKKEHLHYFPAIHLRPMDRWDFLLKFSNELLIVFLALLVTGMNVIYLGRGANKTYVDNSFASRFLSYHPNLNQNLFQKNTSIITTVARQSGFISQVYAEDFMTPNTENIAEPEQNMVIIGDDGMVKPNPDSIQNLILKQIKVYETKPNDTLAGIAKENGISIQTLMWANKLSSQSIKPGWFLLILPTDGVLYKANSNDTLPDIAKKYSGDLDTIIAYNGLENAEDIDSEQLVIIPNGKIPQPPAAPKPKTSPKTIQPKTYYAGTGHIFPWGYCTYYVATKVHVPWGGNAKNWLANAKAYGAVISSKPAVGSIVVTTDNRRYGHVALVEKVEDDRFLISEMNYKGLGIKSTRWISNTSKTVRGFIYP